MSEAAVDEYLQTEFPGATIEHETESGSPTKTFVVSSNGRRYLLKLGRAFLAFPEHEYVPRLEQFGAVDALKLSAELGVLVTETGIMSLNTILTGVRRN